MRSVTVFNKHGNVFIALHYFSSKSFAAPDPTLHSGRLSPHVADQSHILVPHVAPDVSLRRPQSEESERQSEVEREVVFLNVSAERPVQAVLPPLINPPVSSLLPDGLYQPPRPQQLPEPLEYDDYDNAIDDGNTKHSPNHSPSLSLFLPISFIFLFLFCYCFLLLTS